MQILYITDYLPVPPISGDRIRVFNLIKRVAAQHQVTLLCLFSTSESPKDLAELMEICERVEVVHHQWPDPGSIIFDLISYFLSGKPIELRLLYSKKLVDIIRELVNQKDFDIVHIEHSRMGLYLDTLPKNEHRRSLLTFHNVDFDQYKRISSIEKRTLTKIRTWIRSKSMQYWEPRYAEKFDQCITVSDVDSSILLRANPRLHLEVIPNGIDTVKYELLEASPNTPSLLFVGSMSYSPCADGAIYFCTQVLPYIKKEYGDIKVWIVGANPPAEVTALANEGIHVTGFVEDVLPYYKQATVSIVPLRAGGGTRLKILESMALGRPVVSTSIGCEGLEVEDGKHLLIADDPKEFAESVISLLRDNDLYDHIASHARELAVAKYDWNVISRQLLDIYDVVQHKSNADT